jgi:hypothetical protein
MEPPNTLPWAGKRTTGSRCSYTWMGIQSERFGPPVTRARDEDTPLHASKRLLKERKRIRRQVNRSE